jgi:hypothetical protein
MPACHIDDARRRGLAFLNDPKLLDRRPSSPSLRTRQNRNLAHVCSFACKSISKLSRARLPSGRRPPPKGYLDCRAAHDRPTRELAHADPKTDGKTGLGSGPAAERAGCCSGCGASGRILGFPAQGSSRPDQRRRTAPAIAFGNPAACAARFLPALRSDRGNSDGRCDPPVRREGCLEVMLTCCALQFSRVQSSAMVVIRPETISSSHRRPRAMAATNPARRSECWGRTSL